MSPGLYTTTNHLHSPRYSFCQCRFIAPFHRPQDFGGSIPRREGEVNLAAWRWCLRARRAPRRVVSLQMCWGGPHSQPAAGAQPPCPLHTQLPSLYLWFLNRRNISKQSLYIFILLFSILFFFSFMGNLTFTGTKLAQKPLFQVRDTTEKWVSLSLQSIGFL